MKKALIPLTIGGFSLGMAEFMMMGVLPDVSDSLGISIPTAGHLISAYALGVVIGAPLMVGLFSKLNPKKVLIGLMLAFAFFNVLFALSPDYNLLLISRVFSGLPHGAFFGIGAVVASKLAAPGKEARAISMMFAGLTIANIFGVPLGTYIGHNFSWRISFFMVASFGLITALSTKWWLPVVEHAKTQSFKSSIKVFTTINPWLIIGISAIGTGGMFAWISYIAPLMTEVTGYSKDTITYIMIIAGLGMALGNYIGGRLADTYSPLVTTTLLLVAMVIALFVVAGVSQYKVPAVIMTFITGAIAFAVIAPMQMLMINNAKGSEMIASAVLQATANFGNAIGAFLGGLPIAAGYGYISTQYVGVALACAGIGFCIILLVRERTSKNTTLLQTTN
ncbi:MAG: MFS transporter [Flavobacterium sp.]|nr:MFS transporter [Pedobacter sp.]